LFTCFASGLGVNSEKRLQPRRMKAL